MTGLEYTLKLLGIPQKTIVRLLNVSQGNFSNWVRGKRDIPEKHLSKLSTLTNVDPKYLVLKNLSEIERLTIEKQIEESKDPGSDSVRVVEMELQEEHLLAEIRRYIKSYEVPFDEDDAYDLDNEQYRMIWRSNLNRIERMVDLLNSFDGDAIDSLFSTLLRMKWGYKG